MRRTIITLVAVLAFWLMAAPAFALIGSSPLKVDPVAVSSIDLRTIDLKMSDKLVTVVDVKISGWSATLVDTTLGK